MSLGPSPENLEQKEQVREKWAQLAGLPLEKARPFFTTADASSFKEAYNRFVKAFPAEAKRISDARHTVGIGPGENVAYFVHDDIHLGGQSLPIDLYKLGQPFAEVKAGVYTKRDNAIYDFKLSQDSGAAVSLLLNDLQLFNQLHREITGTDIPGWVHGEVGHLKLEAWKNIDLEQLAKARKGLPRESVHLPIDTAGHIFSPDRKKELAHWDDLDVGPKIKKYMLTEYETAVDNTISTIQKVAHRWRRQAYADYINQKLMALVNANTLEMVYFGYLTEEQVELYRVTRKQPKARVHL